MNLEPDNRDDGVSAEGETFKELGALMESTLEDLVKDSQSTGMSNKGDQSGTSSHTEKGAVPKKSEKQIPSKMVDNNDAELNALMDSALEDFYKPLPNLPQVSGQVETTSSATKKPPAPPKHSHSNIPSLTDPLGPGLAQFEEAMRSFLKDEPAFNKQMQDLTDTGDGADDEAFAASLAETLKGIADNAQSLSENPTEEELSRVLGNLGLSSQENDSGSMPNLIPLMQNVMQSLLSKDLLYPALKEIVDKYPDWLAEKRISLPKDQYEKYNKQYELMKQVCDEFDTEEPSDSEQIKKSRFERILQLMQTMQDCGHPPKELVGELGPDVQLDEQGNLKLPGFSNEQCNIM